MRRFQQDEQESAGRIAAAGKTTLGLSWLAVTSPIALVAKRRLYAMGESPCIEMKTDADPEM